MTRAWHVAGVDIGGTQCSVNLARFSPETGLKLLARAQFATRVARGPAAILGDIGTRLTQLVRDLAPGEVVGIGVSCGGPLDREVGVIQSPPNLPGWDAVPIVEILADRLGIPTFLENDANANALAEWAFGAGRTAQHLVYLTFGTGLGAGIVADGRLHLGAGGLAGEVGHWRIGPRRGPRVYGKQGSFEGYCSGAGIAAWYRYWGGAGPDGAEVTAKDVATRAREGEPLAGRVFAQSAQRLGEGIALLVDAFAPECVVIGGVYTYATDLLERGMMQTLQQEAHPSLLKHVRVVPAGLGGMVGSYASLAVVLYRLGMWQAVTEHRNVE